MKYTNEELAGKSVHTLRVILRELGGVPGLSDKKQLIDGIISIQEGEKPPARSPRGRKPIEGLIALSTESDIKLNVLEFRDIPMGEKYYLTGIVEICNGKYGFLRGLNCTFTKKDCYILPTTVTDFKLKHGDEIEVVGEKIRETGVLTVREILSINGFPASKIIQRKDFDTLSPRYPTERIVLGSDNGPEILKSIDLLCPIGKGQRVIVTADGDRYNGVIRQIVKSVSEKYGDITLVTLLSGVKPEEVTEYNDIENCRNTVLTDGDGEFTSERKLDLLFSNLKRIAECGESAVVIINSLDSLAKIFTNNGEDSIDGIKKINNIFSTSGNYGKGSITLIGVVNRADSELYRKLSEIATCEIALVGCNERGENKRLDVKKSYTVKDEYLLSGEEIELADKIRKNA